MSLSWSPGSGSAPANYTLTASKTPGGAPVATIGLTTSHRLVRRRAVRHLLPAAHRVERRRHWAPVCAGLSHCALASERWLTRECERDRFDVQVGCRTCGADGVGRCRPGRGPAIGVCPWVGAHTRHIQSSADRLRPSDQHEARTPPAGPHTRARGSKALPSRRTAVASMSSTRWTTRCRSSRCGRMRSKPHCRPRS